jgi:hypothetical protein
LLGGGGVGSLSSIGGDASFIVNYWVLLRFYQFSDVNSSIVESSSISSRTESFTTDLASHDKRISITTPRGSEVKKHIDGTLLFTLRLGEAAEEAVPRKFRDFVELRLAFARAYPGCYVPTILKLEVSLVRLLVFDFCCRRCQKCCLTSEDQRHSASR